MACVLVIEDDPLVAEVVRYTLTDAGYDVHTAQEGPSGLATAGEVSPDAVVLDFRLPGMDGREVLHALEGRYPQLPVSLFTVYGDLPDRVALPEADGCFVKSSDLTPLVAAIGRAVGLEGGNRDS